MRFVVAIFGGDGRVWAIPYRQPVSGAEYYRKAAGATPDRGDWHDVDFNGAALCFDDLCRANAYQSSTTVVLAFITPADRITLIDWNRELTRQQRDCLAEVLQGIIRRTVDVADLDELTRLLAPTPGPDHRAILTGLGLSAKLADAIAGRTGGGDVGRLDDNGAVGWYPDEPKPHK